MKKMIAHCVYQQYRFSGLNGLDSMIFDYWASFDQATCLKHSYSYLYEVQRVLGALKFFKEFDSLIAPIIML